MVLQQLVLELLGPSKLLKVRWKWFATHDKHADSGFTGSVAMPLISISRAAKLYDVSRPTLQKALKDGAISGQKVRAGGSESWQIDTAELARLYQLRGGNPDNEIDRIGQSLDVEKQSHSSDLPEDLVKEMETLKAALAQMKEDLDQEREGRIRAEAVRDERGRIIDEMIKALPRPTEQVTEPGKRSFWARLLGR